MNSIGKNKLLSGIITRVLLSIIFLLVLLIINKYNKNLLQKFKDNLFNKSLNFIKVNKISQKILGKDVFYYQDNKNSAQVLSTQFDLENSQKYFNSYKIAVSNNLPIGSIQSGVVIYIGEKEIYGNTVIIQGVDGFNIWYSNLKDINVNIYDYIEKQSLIGSADGEYVYLQIEKDGTYYSYSDYVKNKN